MKHQIVKPLAAVRPDRPTPINQDDLSRLMRQIVTDAVSRMALIDANRRGPQSNSASAWRASQA